MTQANPNPAVTPAAVLSRWERTLATLADNDNEPKAIRAKVVAAVLGLPVASTAAIAACLRFLL